MKRGIFAAVMLTAGLPLAAQAAIIGGWGAEARTGTAGFCPSFCTGNLFASSSDGGMGIPVAASAENSFASSRAEARLTGNGFLPILRAEATADPGRRGEATAFGVQGYTYEGSAATTLQLDLNLTGIVGNGPTGYTDNEISGRIGVVKTNEIDFISDFGTLMFEAVSREDVIDIVNLFISGASGRTRGSITLDLNPGDDYFVVASLKANAQNGFARGFNTLELQYQDAAGLALSNEQLGGLGLVSASEPLPMPKPVSEPSLLVLLLTGLLGLVGIRRFARAVSGPRRGLALLPA